MPAGKLMLDVYRKTHPNAAKIPPLGHFAECGLTYAHAMVRKRVNVQNLEEWKKLCLLAVVQRDPDRLAAIMRATDRLLGKRQL
jgi:hypothetical protein